jgi:hypothetical protein
MYIYIYISPDRPSPRGAPSAASGPRPARPRAAAAGCCMRACVRACARACMRACVRACVRACALSGRWLRQHKQQQRLQHQDGILAVRDWISHAIVRSAIEPSPGRERERERGEMYPDAGLPSSPAAYTRGRGSGGSGFETRSGVIPHAARLKRGPLLDCQNRLGNAKFFMAHVI